MEWLYVYFHVPTGRLIDEMGDTAIFAADGKTPVIFKDFAEADNYLEENGIRATIAA